MTTDERERLLEQAYDAERAGNPAEAERLRRLAHAPQELAQEPPAATPTQPRPFRYFHWITPPRGR